MAKILRKIDHCKDCNFYHRQGGCCSHWRKRVLYDGPFIVNKYGIPEWCPLEDYPEVQQNGQQEI